MFRKIKEIAKEVLPARQVDFIASLIDGRSKLDILKTNIENVFNSQSIEKKTNDKKAILRAHEFKVRSQFFEDGLVAYIFSKIGYKNCTFVEIGCGSGTECMTANLSLNLGWKGVLIDGNAKNIEVAKKFYREQLGSRADGVTILHKFVTKENINKILKANTKRDIDLLVIDVDGVDYWIWKAIDAVKPRVIVAEYNASLGDKDALTVKYKPNFNRFDYHPSGYYHGASLKALTKLAGQKGYSLVGCGSAGINAFFVRKELISTKLNKMTAEQAYYPHMLRSEKMSATEQKNLTKTMDYIKV